MDLYCVTRLVKEGMLALIRLLYLRERLLVAMANKFSVGMSTDLANNLTSFACFHFSILLLDTTFAQW